MSRLERMVALPEIELIGLCRRGDAEAWDELFNRYYSAAGRFVYQLAPEFSREDVEEICQETFISVIKHLVTFQGSSQFQTWLFRIAANKARDYRARQMAAKRGGGQIPVSLHSTDPANGAPLDVAASLPGPDMILMSLENRIMLRKALDRLGEPCREIIELRYFGELSYEEISSALDLHLKTVSSRLSKCLDRLETVASEIFSGEKSRIIPSNR